MALNQRGTPNHQYNGSGTTITVSKPTGVVANDIMFAVMSTETAYTNSTPSGWTSLGKDNSTYFYELFYRVADGNEGASFQWGLAASQKSVGVVIAYQAGQFNHISPIDQFSNTAYTTSDTTNRAASMTVTNTNSPLVFFGIVQDNAVARTQTKPSVPTTDWVEDFDDGDTSAGSFVEICSMVWSGSGATGNMDSTISASKTTKHAFAVALNYPPSVTVSPSVIDATFSVQAPAVAAGATVSTTVIDATFSVQAPTVTFPTPDFTNLDKSTTATFTNPDKS